MNRLFLFALLGLIACLTGATDELTVLGDEIDGAPTHEMMRRYLEGIAETCFERRAAAYEALETPEDIQVYQQRMRDFFIAQLGGFPERVPLEPRIVATGEGDGYRYEKTMYTSQPGLDVTAVLFLPLTPPPYPGVLVPCGHSNNGKASEVYQRACILLARNGIAAFIYDPVGQGERYYYFKKDGTPRFGTTLHHTLMGVGAILTGTNTAMYRIWDGMRGIDYLCSRDDIDPDRIGCTGNSGGGTLTSYIMALDARVQCAAPSCYLTTFKRLLATIGPQDAEQDIHAQIAFGMDHADYLHMRAPKPTLMCAATQDFFDIDGTWQTFREAKRLYTRLGFAERVDLVEAGDKHGFSQPRREAAARWMARWLLGKDEAIVEPEFAVLTDQEMQCTPKGQVIWTDGARSVFDLNAERNERLAPGRQAFWHDTPKEEALEKVREVVGARRPADLSPPEMEVIDTLDRDGYRIEKLTLRPEAGIVLPALLFLPQAKVGEGVVYCHGDGNKKACRPGGPVEELVRQGKAVLAVELRGIGETESLENLKRWRVECGPDWTDYFRAYLVDKTFVGMRTEDIWASAQFLKTRLGDSTPLTLAAVREAAVPALHAAVLAPGLFQSATLENGIPSWSDVVSNPNARDQLINTVHGALEVYDLPDLLNTAPAGSIRIVDPAVPEF